MSEAIALKLLQNSYKNLLEEPVEGFLCVPHEDDFFKWKVYIEGPRETPFEEGIFELVMKFPKDFPMMPPKLKFLSEFWHPNVFDSGDICISILHPPGEDEMSNEHPGERWMPSQTVSSILLSVISMLNDPNFSSPANVDASVMWRSDFEKYKKKVRELVEKSKDKYKDIKIPHPESNPTERKIYLEKQKLKQSDFFDYDDYGYASDDDNNNQIGSEDSVLSHDEFGKIEDDDDNLKQSDAGELDDVENKDEGESEKKIEGNSKKDDGESEKKGENKEVKVVQENENLDEKDIDDIDDIDDKENNPDNFKPKKRSSSNNDRDNTRKKLKKS